MKFLIVGPGAMGCLYAACLKKAGFEVAFLDYNKDRINVINRKGIQIEGVTGEHNVNVPASVGEISFLPDVILICVKSYKTREACEIISPQISQKATIISLQNGLGNIEILEEIFGKSQVLLGVTSEGATLLEWGKVKHAGQGNTTIGSAANSDNHIDQIVSAFEKAGFKTKSAPNIDELLWAKLIINVGINALTAIVSVKNGQLPELHGARVIMRHAVMEAVTVAEAKGIQLPYPDPVQCVLDVCYDTSGNIASMLQDVLKEKMTEIDFINGAVVREGETLGIPTPVNSTLTSLIQAIQDSYPNRI